MIEIIEQVNKTIYLVGTAHISPQSVKEVEDVILEKAPDTICIELCASRFQALKQKKRWQEMDIVQVIKQGKTLLLLANLLMGSYQKKMGNKLGVEPGAEMLKAVSVAEKMKVNIVFADREISVTMKRAWRELPFLGKLKLIFQMSFGAFSSSEIEQKDIDDLLEKEAIHNMIEELGKKFPVIHEVVIDERDQYLAAKIASASGRTVVAVIGAGHLEGIKKYLSQEIDLERLMLIPPPSKIGKFLKYFLPALVIAIIVYGFWFSDAGTSWEIIKWWVLINGSLSALGALLAKGHILTVAGAFVAAPFTSINPAIAAGWVAGLIEAWVKKPKVADFEHLLHDITTLKGFRNNEITKILLVVVLTNIGSALGTLVAIPLITSFL